MSLPRDSLLFFPFRQIGPDLKISCCGSSDDVGSAAWNAADARMEIDSTEFGGSVEGGYFLAEI
jgi:hypothetical protein